MNHINNFFDSINYDAEYPDMDYVKCSFPLVETTRPGADFSHLDKLKEFFLPLPCQDVTITFKPNFQLFEYIDQHRLLKSRIKEFEQRPKFSKLYRNPLNKHYYLFIPEITESGMLHYHGIMVFSNAVDYWIGSFKSFMNRNIGRTKGKEVYEFTNWWKYITKDKNKDYGQLNIITNIDIDKL